LVLADVRLKPNLQSMYKRILFRGDTVKGIEKHPAVNDGLVSLREGRVAYDPFSAILASSFTTG
jgi:hypothetical protein